MAGRAQPVRPGAGYAATVFVAAFVLVALAAVAFRAEPSGGLKPVDWAAIRFTVTQALLSALVSVALAIPVARALARRHFLGRDLLISLLGAPFILPVIVAVLGLLAVFGRAGIVNLALGKLGLPPIGIYGLHGVVLAHVFLNLPLATRLLLQGWSEIPAERFRLAGHLGCSARDIWHLLERPMLSRLAPGAFAIVFAICLTSFAVALTLGGGPKATTVELAIYEAFRYEFDLNRAAQLAMVQIVLTLGAGAVALALTQRTGFGAGLDRPVTRWDANTTGLRVQDGIAISLAAAFLLVPLGALVVDGIPRFLSLPWPVWRACLASLGVALGSLATMMLIAVAMTTALALGRRHWIDLVGLLGMAVSPLVIGTGWFLLINPVYDPAALALPMTAIVNAVMALPFALRILVPAARSVIADFGPLGAHLNMRNGAFLRLVLLPRLAPQLGFAAGLGAALSLGDLGVITLFANPEMATLPLQIFRLMGAFRMADAASAGLLLMMLAFSCFWICDWGGRRYAGR